jgi:hypothetical protein
MRMSLLRRVIFVALMWGAVGLVNVELQAAWCEECAPIWSACNNNCWALYSNNQSELEACLDGCEEDYWECTFTCDWEGGAQCTAWECWDNADCEYACGWVPSGCSQETHRCCCLW